MKKFTLFTLAVLCASWLVWWLMTNGQPRHQAIHDAPVKFTEIQINASSPKRLSEFYKLVFDATDVNLSKQNVRQAITPSDSLLWTPGYREQGPTLYFKALPIAGNESTQGPLLASDYGFAHLCFEADDVGAIIQRIESHGGNIISRYRHPARQPVVYAQDPEGNVIEVHVPLPSPANPSTLSRFAKSLINSYWGLGKTEPNSVRFLHVNINSKDWQQSAKFYVDVFGAAATGKLRDYEGDFIENLTAIDGVIVKGGHFAVPGYHLGGPTLEMFTYTTPPSQGPLTELDKGVVAIGFHVADMKATLNTALSNGAKVIRRSKLNDVVLVTDPNGNLVRISSVKGQPTL